MSPPEPLVRHLSDRLGLSPAHARRVIEEVLAYYDEPVEAYVRRRHTGLQREGWRNDAIFAQLQVELRERRFPGPEASMRQLRRWIYG